MNHLQSINMPLTTIGSGQYLNNTLNAALVGGVDTACLRYNAAGVFDAQLFAEQGTLANNGTVVAIIQPGVYTIETLLVQAATADNTYGLCLGATVVTNGTAITYATAGILRLASGLQNAAASDSAISLTATVLVRTATAKITPTTTSANTVRVLATATATGAPTLITVASCGISITKINDLSA